MESDKYNKALKEHPFEMDEAKVNEKVNEIIDANFQKNNSQAVYKLLYSCLDLTTLNTTDSRESVWSFTERINAFEDNFPNLKNVAAICVFPNFAKTVKEALTVDVNIACVSGGFPSSQTFSEIKIAETALAVADGADEIDVVMNLGLFFDNDYEELAEELAEIKEACRKAKLKVILETGALKTVGNIHCASVLSMYSGADFLKTSTGKVYEGASLIAAYTMCSAIKSYYGKTGSKIGFKVSGGVATVEDAVKYYSIVKDVLGEDWCSPEYFRIGASRLADKLLEVIKDEQI